MAKTRKIRVLVVDDSALMRRVITNLLAEDPGIEVVDTARDGELSARRASDSFPSDTPRAIRARWEPIPKRRDPRASVWMSPRAGR